MRYLVFLLLALSTSLAYAHDWWLDFKSPTYTLHQGHAHSDHGGEAVVPYQADIVKKVLCASPSSNVTAIPFSRKHPVTFSAACDAVLVSLSSGYWTKTPWGTKNTPKTGVTGVLKSWHSSESIKRINRWSSAGKKPFSKGLEITPGANPFAIGVGDKLIVKVTLDGKPVPDVPVAYQGDTRGATDAQGNIAIRIRQTGVQLISASFETPLKNGKADTAIRTAHLQFDLNK